MADEFAKSDQQVEALSRAVARMLQHPPVSSRTVERVLREYDGDKYGGILKTDPRTWDDVLEAEASQTGRHANTLEWISRGDQLEFGTAGSHNQQTESLVSRILQAFPSPRYCELGCGFGRFLKSCAGHLNGNRILYGGELSTNGIALAQRFALHVRKFDFNSISDYAFIEPETTVFTVQAVEQLVSARLLLDGLRSIRRNLRHVIHFEPGPYLGRTGAIGHLRNAYTIWNAYNQDLLQLLHSASDVRVLQECHDVFGINPLNSVHAIVWEFTASN